jgi:hypothetical protein
LSALAPRNRDRIADEQKRLESSDTVDLSPASLWRSDYEEEDETTVQGKRVDAQDIDPMPPNLEREGLVETPRQVRILDESQVLPGESSFATVSLNQPIESSVLKPQDSCQPPSTSSVNDYREGRSVSRVQLRDESQVLAGEASFATVMLGEHRKAQRYSPITEFLVKTKLSLKQLVLAVLALVSVLALAMIVLLRTTGPEVVTVSSATPPTNVETASQSVSTSITEPPDSDWILNSQGKVSGSASPTQAATAEEPQGVANAKLIERASSDDSRQAPLSDAKSAAVRQEILGEANPVGVRVSSPKERATATMKQSASIGKKAVKEPAVVKTPNASAKSDSLEAHSIPATKQKELPVPVENVEPKPPPTGGGERPRTVTRKPRP